MRQLFGFVFVLGLCVPVALSAQADQVIQPIALTEWKAVFGRVEARDTIPARSRLGGTLSALEIEEGADVTQGQVLAQVEDDKLQLRLNSVQSQIGGLESQLENARTELERGENLLQRGVTTAQRLDSLRTQVSVLENQIASTTAEREVIHQQMQEGAVLAPIAGRVLEVPVTDGAVVMPGEVIATIGGGGFFLRLAVPERHADFLREGVTIRIGENGKDREGHLAKVYPKIENGRVIADVEVPELDSDFVNARVLVRLPVGERQAIVIPAGAVETRMGLDFVTLRDADELTSRAVVVGEVQQIDGKPMIEVLSGLETGDTLVTHDE